MFKIIFKTLASLLVLVLGYFTFMYFFFKVPDPIMEYEFPSMTYKQLETKIAKITNTKLNSKFNLTSKELLDKQTSRTRIVILGKDSLQFGFVTNLDGGYKYKTKQNHLQDSYPWLELYSVCNSKGKYIGLFNKNKDKYPEVIKLFEDEFIKKINDGKVNVIERGFWN